MQNLGHQARPSSVPLHNCVSKETGASSAFAMTSFYHGQCTEESTIIRMLRRMLA
jgi:hypothetical protein